MYSKSSKNNSLKRLTREQKPKKVTKNISVFDQDKNLMIEAEN